MTATIGEKRLSSSEPNSDVYFEIVTNDGTPQSNMNLIALKTIFSRQLPKMPKEYIVRLVFDHRHVSLAILRQGRVIGGICYRPYYEQRFAEIAFCAINSNEQVKGYGTMLMNKLKSHVQPERIEYFLTYADNFAIGYFQKQGFSKHVAMPKDRWVGFIKDYDGGTLMECYIHPSIDFLHGSDILARQRRFVQDRIDEFKHMDTNLPLNVLDLPGVSEAGWTWIHLQRGGGGGGGSTDRDRNNAQTKLSGQLKDLLNKLCHRFQKEIWRFEEEVDQTEYPDYYKKIRNPVHLGLIQQRHKTGYYRSREAMRADLLRMCENCRLYNCSQESGEYFKAALELELIVKEVFPEEITRL